MRISLHPFKTRILALNARIYVLNDNYGELLEAHEELLEVHNRVSGFPVRHCYATHDEL